MSGIVVIHQPDFLPYLGFFHRLLNCNTFVILDHVQYLKRGWHSRDKLKSNSGQPVWISVPILNKNKIQSIKNVKIDNKQHWKRKHLNSIQSYYQKSKYFNEVYPILEQIYLNKEYSFLVDINLEFISIIIELLNLDNVKIIFSSDLEIISKKNQMNIDIIEKIGSNVYISGIGAKEYLNEDMFKASNIKVIWQKFKHPIYEQVNGTFVPNLSIIDILFNCGIDQTNEILRNC